VTAPAWWETFFDEVFLDVYRPLLERERTVREAAAAARILGLPVGARVLDVACGWGRHALELAGMGFQVTGFDRSPRLLEEAAIASLGVEEVRWVAGDMRDLPFQEEFDAVLSLFSSLGYFDSDEDDLRVLEGMRRAVEPGGRLLLETMHRDLIARRFLERDWWETDAGRPVRVEREFDAVTGTVREMLWTLGPEGEPIERASRIRVRSATEWGEVLRETGWRPLEWLGGWRGDPFTHRSARLILLAEAV